MSNNSNQVGGTHYARQKIDPFTFAMANRWDPMMFSVLKYLSRYPTKGNPVEDLKKAAHITRYRAEFLGLRGISTNIEMARYIKENNFVGAQAYLLTWLNQVELQLYEFDGVRPQPCLALERLARAIEAEIANIEQNAAHTSPRG